jgi:hypothetical protein
VWRLGICMVALLSSAVVYGLLLQYTKLTTVYIDVELVGKKNLYYPRKRLCCTKEAVLY